MLKQINKTFALHGLCKIGKIKVLFILKIMLVCIKSFTFVNVPSNCKIEILKKVLD